MSSSFHARLNFDGDFDALIERVTADFELGRVTGHDVIEVGFEDFNVKLATERGEYLAKIFSRTRTDDEITRNAVNMEQAVEAGVNHPELLRYDGKVLYTDPTSKLKMVVMKFVRGKTFYDLSATPDDHDLALIASEAVKINSIDYEPPYLFDSWALLAVTV